MGRLAEAAEAVKAVHRARAAARSRRPWPPKHKAAEARRRCTAKRREAEDKRRMELVFGRRGRSRRSPSPPRTSRSRTARTRENRPVEARLSADAERALIRCGVSGADEGVRCRVAERCRGRSQNRGKLRPHGTWDNTSAEDVANEGYARGAGGHRAMSFGSSAPRTRRRPALQCFRTVQPSSASANNTLHRCGCGDASCVADAKGTRMCRVVHGGALYAQE